MNRQVTRWARRLRAWLAGPKFARSVARHNRAALALDQAVREVLTR